MRRTYLLSGAIVFTIAGFLLMENFRLDKMFQIERNLIKTQASILLDELLTVELKRSAMERYDVLEKEGLVNKGEGWGSSYEDTTITVLIVYPEYRKMVRKCNTREEWYEYSNENNGRYHISGINLARMDSAFKTALESKGITLPYILGIRDSSNNILEQTPSDFVDYSHYQLSLDDMRLGIDDKDFLVARFDESRLGMFRQTRNMLFASFEIALLFSAILFYLLYTVFYQMKIAVEKEKFSKGVVHDLRKPAEFLKSIHSDIKEGENPQKYIGDMKYEIDNLLLMIENLLCTSITKQTQFIRKEAVLLYEYLDEIVGRYKMRDETVHISLTCDDASITANIDPFHFGNVMMNLIENAIKYSEGHSEICIGCFRKDNCIHVTVKDQGVGISKQYISRIFKKHYRIPERDSIPRNGFGLGLYYVKTVAIKHGGDVYVKSEYRKGSEFTITVPADLKINT